MEVVIVNNIQLKLQMLSKSIYMILTRLQHLNCTRVPVQDLSSMMEVHKRLLADVTATEESQVHMLREDQVHQEKLQKTLIIVMV